MKRNKTIIFGILSIAILFSILLRTNEEVATLEEEIAIDKRVEDFVLHVKVEQATQGINVHQSLQYVGSKPIEIKHQTPLVSVSLDDKNHDFTGSLVSRELHGGNIYYQESVNLPRDEEGECKLYVKAKFYANGEIVDIKHAENLMFN